MYFDTTVCKYWCLWKQNIYYISSPINKHHHHFDNDWIVWPVLMGCMQASGGCKSSTPAISMQEHSPCRNTHLAQYYNYSSLFFISQLFTQCVHGFPDFSQPLSKFQTISRLLWEFSKLQTYSRLSEPRGTLYRVFAGLLTQINIIVNSAASGTLPSWWLCQWDTNV